MTAKNEHASQKSLGKTCTKKKRKKNNEIVGPGEKKKKKKKNSRNGQFESELNKGASHQSNNAMSPSTPLKILFTSPSPTPITPRPHPPQ